MRYAKPTPRRPPVAGQHGVPMLRRYRYRAYPTGGQQVAALRLFGCVRVVWNDALAARESARRDGLPIPGRRQLSNALTASKRTFERSWLGEVSSVPLQQSLADLDRAYQNFFDSLSGRRRGRKMRPPRFKKRSGRQSARFTQNSGFKVCETTHGAGFVTLPKVGQLRYESSRPLPSDPSSVTFTREPDGRHYVSFVVYVARSTAPASDIVVGIDLGLIDLAAVVRSDGTREKVANPRWLRSKERRLSRLQRAASRKQQGSKNRIKSRVTVAAQHRKVRDARLDHHHKLALRLVRENQVVAFEGLSVAGLARTRMAKSINDAGWATLIRLVQEKADALGRQVRVIDRWEPTSQVCSFCGVRDGKKSLLVREWTCSSCGARLDRDYNAAVNIMVAAGLAETLNACGGDIRLRLAAAAPGEAGTYRTDLTVDRAA